MGAVELEEVVVGEVLVGAVGVVNGPVFVVGEEVFSEGEVGFGVAEGVEDGGHDVDLLCGGVEDAGGELSGGVVDGDGDGEEAE